MVFIDETSAKVNIKRGYFRSWRKADEIYHPDIKRIQIKTYFKLQFYAAFTYNFKGLCHVWFPEKEEEKLAAEEVITEENEGRAGASVLEEMSRS